MLKSDIMNMINDFESETWKYDSTDELDSDMQYIYSIESELKNIDDSYIEQIYNKLIAMIGIIRFKYGFESSIINTMPELERLEKYINEIQLNSNDIINQYNYILNYYTNIINRNHDLGFIKNKYINVEGKEGLFLAVESLKSLISNSEYRQMLDSTKINEVLIDCVKLNNGAVSLEKIEMKYQEIIRQIYEQSGEATQKIIKECFFNTHHRTIRNLVATNAIWCSQTKAYQLRDTFIKKVARGLNIDTL